MISVVHTDKFRILYATARELVKRNAASDARRYALALMDVLREMYDCASVVERAKITVMLKQWLHVAAELREKGVTPEIVEFFGLNARGVKVEESRENATRLDGIYDTARHDWCADLFDKYRGSVATVTCSTRYTESSGTGFVIERGYLVTNRHVVYNASSGRLFPKATAEFNGDGVKRDMKIIAADKDSDVALCAFDGDARAVPMIADYSKLRQGADVLIIGNAFSFGLAPFTGTVRFTRDEHDNLVYTAPSNPGDSGGPVINSAGECVGINKSITTSVVRGGQRMAAQGLTNATPSDRIQALLSEWLK